MPVGDQIRESVMTSSPNLSKEEAWEDALRWLRRVQINHVDEVARQYPHQLSGGMCQRVAIAQILALRPEVLIADEPTTGLDATIQASILDLIKDVQTEFNLSVMLITHDFSVVERLADRILVLFRGRLLELGEADAILPPGARLHPYTSNLLKNVRVLEGAGGEEQIRAIGKQYQQGRPPRIGARQGCNYLPHCPVAAAGGEALQARCAADLPPFVALSAGHELRCHAHEALIPEDF